VPQAVSLGQREEHASESAKTTLERIKGGAGGATGPHTAGSDKGAPAAAAPQGGFPTVGVTDGNVPLGGAASIRSVRRSSGPPKFRTREQAVAACMEEINNGIERTRRAAQKGANLSQRHFGLKPLISLAHGAGNLSRVFGQGPGPLTASTHLLNDPLLSWHFGASDACRPPLVADRLQLQRRGNAQARQS
jgi:hypothetical protein